MTLSFENMNFHLQTIKTSFSSYEESLINLELQIIEDFDNISLYRKKVYLLEKIGYIEDCFNVC